jgi:hypothetical protein
MSISGKVSDLTGTPISKAEVRAEMEGTQDPRYATRTSATGQFELSGLESGSYTITVTSLGFDRGIVHRTQVSLDHPRAQLNNIVLQVGSMCSGGCVGFESPESGSGILRIPRRCAFYLDTGEVTCILRIGEREPVEPPQNASSYLWISSNAAGDLDLTPRNGAVIAQSQQCETTSYNDKPVRLDDLNLGDRICAQSAEGNRSELIFVRTVARGIVEVRQP